MTKFSKVAKRGQNSRPATFLISRLSPIAGKAAFSISVLLIALLAAGAVFSQDTEANADKILKGNGRVNPSTLAMEIDIPLGKYPGRGINVPISISYSSKVWRILSSTKTTYDASPCHMESTPKFADDSTAGWTSSLDVPSVEYTGWIDKYYKGVGAAGYPAVGDHLCPEPEPDYADVIRRITVRMPSGETHELRMDAGLGTGATSKNGYYYAADGSNIVYYENSGTNTYRLMMPDGSYYDMDPSGTPSIRRAINFCDRNGTINCNTYSSSTNKWTDKLGRQYSSPFNSISVGTIPYQLPGMSGTYDFHWDNLENAFTNPSDQLHYAGDTYKIFQHPWLVERTSDPVLFNSVFDNYVLDSVNLFNPVVLTKIELPNGQAYEFSYDVYGRIDKIKYPTGAEETFTYAEIHPLTPTNNPGNDVSVQMNYGVVSRTVTDDSYSPTATYNWTYSTEYVDPKGYKITIVNPQGIKTERFLHRGIPDCSGCSGGGSYGFSDSLIGRAYETRVYDKNDNIVGRSLMHWTKLSFGAGSGTSDWHPRLTHEENYVYDPANADNYVWSTVKYEYEDLSTFNKPLLRKKVLQYAYQASGGGSPTPPAEGGLPDPNPTPVPTPTPGTLVRSIVTTHLIYDPDYTSTKDIYINKNMIGLVTATEVRDHTDTNVVSRSETVYDESGSSPGAGYGNPTTSRVWDSTKGLVTNSSAYITTSAKFDNWGNRTETTDANGNVSTTTYDANNAFPVTVTSAVPDSDGSNGSNTAFVTQATFDTTTGLPLTTTDANGIVTKMEYDPVTLRLIKVRRAFGTPREHITETIYDDANNKITVKSQIDSTNWSQAISYYDGLGRTNRTETVNSQGNIFVEKEFYDDGTLKRVSNPYRYQEPLEWTTNVYDDAGRLIEVTLQDGAKVLTSYGVSTTGKIGTTKEITDQAGKKRKGITDVLGRMIRVVEDPSGTPLETDYVFDTLGNIRETIQGVQHRYFRHDSLGRLMYSKQPEQEANGSFSGSSYIDPVTSNDQWSMKYLYDDNGNITSITDARNITVIATYDRLNRVVKRDYSDTSMPDVDFYYDGTGIGGTPTLSKGQTTRVASSVSETRYTSFDEMGRVLTHEQRTTPGQLSGTETPYQTVYTYNLSGAVLTETYPSGREITHDYDSDGILDELSGTKPGQTGSKTYLSHISYDSAGNIEKMRLGNGRWETAEFNARQQITQIGLGYSENDASLLNITYDYGTSVENNGSLRKQTIDYTGLASPIEQTYSYDALNRISVTEEKYNSGANQSWKQTFSYDRYGNRTFDAANTTTLAANDKITNPSIDATTNRIIEDQDGGGIDYDFDKNGNLTLDAENKRYVYDAENRVKEYFRGSNGTSTPDAVYQYDGDGKRVRKTADGVETIFVYNAGGELIAEYSTEIPDEPKVNYLTADHLGSPRIVTDALGGIVSRHDYHAFGEEVVDTVGVVGGRSTDHKYDEQDDIRKQYTGYERDDESGLDFAQARYYNSRHGRYTSVDPLTASASIKNPQTFNRYSYVLNSPYKFTDPLGLIPERQTGAWGWGTKTRDDDTGGFADPANEEEENTTEQEAESQNTENTDGGGQNGKQQEAKDADDDSESVAVGEATIDRIAERIAFALNDGFTTELELLSEYREARNEDNPNTEPGVSGEREKALGRDFAPRLRGYFNEGTDLMRWRVIMDHQVKANALGVLVFKLLSNETSQKVARNRSKTENQINRIIREESIKMSSFRSPTGGRITGKEQNRATTTAVLRGIRAFLNATGNY